MSKGIDDSTPKNGAKYGNQIADPKTNQGDELMQSIRDTADMQMRFQSEMGLIQFATKMNEAVAKTLKAAGESVKGLAG